MTKTLNRMTKAWILIVGISIFFTACEKETTEEIITQQKKFDAPSIESAKQFINSSHNTSNANVGLKSSILTSATHWEGSKTKKYKQTEELDVDILYTPIYVNSPRTDIKGFVASTEQNGIIDSRKFYILYKSNNLSNGLNAYILIYGLDGNLQFAYNFVNGESVSLPESTNNGNTLNKSFSECTEYLSTMTDEEFENWWANCSGITLDEVIVTGPAPLEADGGTNGGNGSAFNDWNSNQWVGIHIPAVTSPEGSNYNNGGTNSDINVNWHNPNVTVANAPSIAAALDTDYFSGTANWLRQMEQDNQQLLNQIAAYLNANREQNPFSDFTFDHIQPEQFPVSDEAIIYLNEIINSGVSGTLISAFPFFQYPIGSDYSSIYPNLTVLLNEYMELLKTRENLINTIHDLTGVSTEDIIDDLTWGEGPIVEIQDLGYDDQGNEIKGKFNPMQNPNVIYIDIDLVNYLENLSSIENPTPEQQQQLAMLNGLIVYAVALHEYVHYADFAFDGTMQDNEDLELGELFEAEFVGGYYEFASDGTIILIPAN